MEEQIKPSRPDSHLIWAILSCLFCCLPTGIYAIIRASQVDGCYDRGDYETAQRYASEAKRWSIIGAVVSLVGGVIYIIFIVFLGLLAGTAGM
ncbi:MAG: CD225/dispanin family protein [Bacteroidales bacterium]|nr:CD225/dispanin family protein [Candidatus Liminaster caballi]